MHTLNVCYDALHDVSVMYERFQTERVNVQVHTLNLKKQYLTLL